MPTKREVYLDHSATTPIDPRVLEAMMPALTDTFGNASSSHHWGRKAEQSIEDARTTVAKILNCKRSEVVFTGCGSESDNLAIRGVGLVAKAQNQPSRLITTPIEHSAVINTISQMGETLDFETDIVQVNRDGLVNVEAFRQSCKIGGSLASIIYANNEVGTIQDLGELGRIAHENGLLFHTDAVQAGGQLSLDVQALDVDMLSLSAHKFYGPKGVGLLYVKDGIELLPSQSGGSHEQGRRAGTQNTAFIVGLAKALELAYEENTQRVSHLKTMRDHLIDSILHYVDGAFLTGHKERRLPSHASFIIPDVDANALLMHLDMNGIAASSGSACKTGNPEPSEVLLAMGYDRELAKCGLRLTVGIHTTEDDVDYAVDVLASTVDKLRKLSRELAK